MKAAVTILCFFAFATLVHAASEPILAASLKWSGHFGGSATEPHTAYCLMGRGFFQMPTSDDLPKLIEAWIHDHPKAVVVPIASIQPYLDKVRESKLTYVWIVDGEFNLNIELVRQGCFAPETQAVPIGKKPSVGQKRYEAFVDRLIEAAQYANDHKLGIWKNSK